MTEISAEARIQAVALAVHYIMYPRRQRRSALLFAKVADTFVHPEVRNCLTNPEHKRWALDNLIRTTVTCAEAFRKL